MCCFNKVNLSAILLVHKRIRNITNGIQSQLVGQLLNLIHDARTLEYKIQCFCSLHCIGTYSLEKCIVRPVYKNIYNAVCIDKETTVECYILSNEAGVVLNRLNSVVNRCSKCSNVTMLCILPRSVCACLLRVAVLVEITCLAQN